MSLESLGLKTSQWKFLLKPDDYVRASKAVNLSLVSESTRRQFKTAWDILDRLFGKDPLKGVLLADDVGLGKTTVAALVAWVVASAEKGSTQVRERCKVRILAPNDAMQRRWAEELVKHVAPLEKCARRLKVEERRVKVGRARLHEGRIQVVKHSYVRASDPKDCDLLIIDEAHRAKGENSKFSKALEKWVKQASRVLILTATPFSIEINELNHMLELVGADAPVRRTVKAFRKALDRLNSGRMGDPRIEAKRLTDNATEAVEALSRFVIRHSVDDLKGEQKSFGEFEYWPIKVKEAAADEVEVMLRMDRSLRLEKRNGSESLSKITNDPRFHVGWRHFDAETERLSKDHQDQDSAASKVISDNVKQIKKLRTEVAHPKMKAVDAAVMETIKEREKVVLFCHHHATAQELTLHLAREMPDVEVPRSPNRSGWKTAWREVLTKVGEPPHKRHNETLLGTFIDWLSSALIRSQVADWLDVAATTDAVLVNQLETSPARRVPKNPETIAKAARQLYRAMLQNNSSFAVLKRASKGLQALPGAIGTSRVLGVCDSESIVKEKEKPLFMHSRQPDLVLEIFNSPFGPDVLVVTDWLSEGIDLHRCCRHLIHYELDPSPIRTVQRNGRVRRVNSWAAITGKPIRYAYPAFAGTRDQRLVSIVKKRLDNFSLLLGGVPDFDVDEVTESDEQWRSDVIKEAKSRLIKSVSGKLVAKEPRDTEFHGN